MKNLRSSKNSYEFPRNLQTTTKTSLIFFSKNYNQSSKPKKGNCFEMPHVNKKIRSATKSLQIYDYLETKP